MNWEETFIVKNTSEHYFFTVIPASNISEFSFTTTKYTPNFRFKKEEVGPYLDKIIKLFPHEEVSYGFELERLANKVARQTRRGKANTLYKNALFYRHIDKAEDAPIIICKKDDMYSINTHPNIFNYGFYLQQIPLEAINVPLYQFYLQKQVE